MVVNNLLLVMQTSNGATYQGASADGDGRGRLADRAVGSSDNGVGVDERTTAEVAAGSLQGDNEGEVTSAGELSTNNLLALGVGVGKGSGRGGQSRESDLHLHIEWRGWSQVLGLEMRVVERDEVKIF